MFTYQLTAPAVHPYFIYRPARILASVLLLLLLLTAQHGYTQDVLAGLTSNGGPEGKGTAFTIKSTGSGFTLLKGFADWGKTPNGSLVLGNDGNYYGMATFGGIFGTGTIFRVSSTGVVKLLYNFNPGSGSTNKGTYPYGSLIKGLDGNFYGMTSAGGTGGSGVIFKLTPAGVYTVLKNFSSATDGARPQGTLVQGKDSTFYGITQIGGTYGGGTIFKFKGSTFKVLHHFTLADGNYSYGSPTLGKDGNLYGLTNKGGSYNGGTIFRLTLAGQYTVLRNLADATDGRLPNYNSMIQASDGNFYGMITYGGKTGYGTIFRLNPSTKAFTVIRYLATGTDGSYPYGNLVQLSDGYLYGMTAFGGSNNGGTIFKINMSGTSFTVLRNFALATDGDRPKGNLIKGADGNLWGLTSEGGANLWGTVFKISSSGTGFTVLARLNGAAYGNAPLESLIQGKDNAYYGTTSTGGKYDYGAIFKICGNTITNLHSFNRPTDGGKPKGSLLQASDGNFYGTTSEGGPYNSGTIFKITPSGTFTIVHKLQASEGSYSFGSLIQGTDGFLYGMTSTAGTYNGGTIFKVKPDATGFAVLRHFSPNADGGSPEGDLIQLGSFLYGVNHTKVFKIAMASPYAYTVLRSMAVNTDGSNPVGSLVLGNDGALYGTASNGGTYGGGTIFKITTAGAFTTLRSLSITTDGGVPKGSLVKGTDGNFYGLTSAGGTYNAGTIFKITPAKAFSVLRHLNLLSDGGVPLGGLWVRKPNPVATAQSITTAEDVAKTITLSGTGGSPMTFTVTTQPKNGTITGGTGATRTYTPKANFNGKDSFAFTANVGCQSSAPAWVKITVTAVNDAPVLAPIGNKSVVKGNTLTFTATATDVDAGQTKTFSLVTPPTGATINATSGVFSWTPTATGSYTFKVRVTDNGSPVLYDEETITVTVTTSAFTTLTTSNASGAASAFAEKERAGATLYPNPVVSDFVITLKQPNGTVQLTIVDEKGAVVYRRGYKGVTTQLRVVATQLKPGAYFAQLQSADGVQTLRFIKQ